MGRGPAHGVLHAPDCEEAPQGAPLLDVEHALNVAENPGTRLCTLCGCAHDAEQVRPHHRLPRPGSPGPYG
ncbi:DUF6233 domain-containing protein [Streptomyces sp. NPDC058676]